MKLHSSLGPNPRLVRMFLVEKGIEEGTGFERVHYDIITGENRQSADYVAKNPLGTMPALELDDGTVLTESWPICEYLEELHPEPNLFGKTPLERAEVRKWVRLFDQEVVVPMTMGFRAGAGRPMFEPRMAVVSAEAGAELSAMSDDKWRYFDSVLGDSNHLALGRFTFADLIMFAFANFGFTVGWKLPEGTDNLARFVATHNERDSAAIWQQAE
ncbi:glutathione S-transferase family protein [Altererythrobacter arenosus]|uniref:Glutathione S-transferase family protein n=1 Tax=Altererythrobacter arenosus TaxID=3032592 RepID=A0ABY8FSC3_9SPHN|nr:glutathione S-transferase family protein [Altererythrobacter sp. CAU 1644]WFL77662.1 glutathione S-transferase family protein [Altererythrobacter sp. CAU 1644]